MARALLSATVLVLPLLLARTIAGEDPSPGETAYRLDLRVHLGASGRNPGDFQKVFAEINRIWFSQSAICFRVETVDHDAPLPEGLDLWFLSDMEGYNGYYGGPHAIRVRDFPVLSPAQDPSTDPAARTAAHELGHALGLSHRQESDDNLMRSKTFGWALNGREIAAARKAAADMGVALPAPLECETYTAR